MAYTGTESSSKLNVCVCVCVCLQEVEGLSVVRRSGEQERQSLLERVEAGRRVVAAAGREAQCLQGQVTELDGLLHRSRAEAQASRGQLHRLLETLAKASGSPGVPGPVVASQEMSEADVVGRVEELCSAQQDAKRVRGGGCMTLTREHTHTLTHT